MFILKNFDLSCFSSNVLKFAQLLPPTVQKQWCRQFTKSVFFFGNPRSLSEKLSHYLTVSCKNMGICGPFQSENKSLNRLFRLMSTVGVFTPSDAQIVIPAVFSKPTRLAAKTLFIDAQNLPLERYLVHLTHTLIESVITHSLLPGDRLNIVHTADIPDVKALYTRVNFAEDGSGQLKLFSLLTNS